MARYFVLDACVLIDFIDADPTILAAVAAHLAPIIVPRPVWEEVEDAGEERAAELGLQIIDIDLSMASAAIAAVGALSFQDNLCLLLAAQHGWSCVTNDGALRLACKNANIDIIWGLELILLLVHAGGLGTSEAKAIATAIHEANPYYITEEILASFLSKL